MSTEAGAGERDVAARFGALYTAAVADVLDELGHTHQTLPPEIGPLERGMRVAGPAFPVEGRAGTRRTYDDAIRRVLAVLGAVPPAHVAVYATNDRAAAQFGELSATALHARGAAGAVLDGGCRDVEFIVREGFPVFTRHLTPQDSVPRWEVVQWGEPVTIEGVLVTAGDYVVGDADGVVVIPAALRDDVLARADAVAGTENAVRDAIRAGLSPLEAFDRHGKF